MSLFWGTKIIGDGGETKTERTLVWQYIFSSILFTNSNKPLFSLTFQAEDLDINYITVDSFTSETNIDPTNSARMSQNPLCTSLKESNQYIYAENEDNQMTQGPGPVISSSNLCTTGSYMPLKSHGFNKERSQLYADVKKRRYGVGLMVLSG